MALRVLTPSTSEPVTVADLRDHVRGVADDNALIEAMGKAAREYVETVTHRTMKPTKYRLSLDCFPPAFELPRSPLLNSTTHPVALSYLADGGSTYTTVSSALYHIDAEAEPGGIYLKANQRWPDVTLETRNSVRVDFYAGSTGEPPEVMKHAVKLLVGHWYENRESVVVGAVGRSVAKTVDALLWSARVPHVP